MGLLGPSQDLLLYEPTVINSTLNERKSISSSTVCKHLTYMPSTDDALLAAFDASYCSVEGVSEQRKRTAEFPLPCSIHHILDITDCGDKPIAYVWSISYNFNPDIIREDITPILQRQCTEFGKVSNDFPRDHYYLAHLLLHLLARSHRSVCNRVLW